MVISKELQVTLFIIAIIVCEFPCA